MCSNAGVCPWKSSMLGTFVEVNAPRPSAIGVRLAMGNPDGGGQTMTGTLSRVGAVALIACLAAPVLAQETSAWSAVQDTDPVECYAVASPTSQDNTRDGETVEVTRSEIRLFVFHRPGEAVNGQVAFTGGYPFAPDSIVTLDVDGTQFALFTEEEWAWPANPEVDNQIVEALRGASEAVLTGQSGRGTVTRDTFSLQGFSSSVDEAQRLCAS